MCVIFISREAILYFIKTLDFKAHDQFIHKVIAVVSMEFKGFRVFANFVFVALSPSSILSQYFTLQLLVLSCVEMAWMP